MQNLANGDLSTEQWVALASLSKEFQTRMGLITFVTIILVLLLSAFFSHQISIPTKRVKDAINTIRDGNYKGVARVETDMKLANF